MSRHFRFESLHIWQEAVAVGDDLFNLADTLEKRKSFRFAEQLRGATLSISNNIAEGSGDDSDKEFRRFLKYARRSAFECANIVIICQRRGYLNTEEKESCYERLDILCRKIQNFRKTLNK
jgi:four helix bundle protein